MIEARELRIGNLALGASRGQVVTVTGRMIEQLEKGLLNVGPIPLTEEWLLKFGFEIVSNYHPEGKTYKLGELRCSEFYNYVSYRNVRITRNEVKYVHQLQNLYFALTEEELKLNDK